MLIYINHLLKISWEEKKLLSEFCRTRFSTVLDDFLLHEQIKNIVLYLNL